MKKGIFTLLAILTAITGFSQATYYWVGGPGPVSFTAGNSWNTDLNGAGSSRSTADAEDILIFDGSNIGGSNFATGPVQATIGSTTIGKLILQNGADVALSRPNTGGTSTLTIGDHPSGDDLEVFEDCTLRLTGTSGSMHILLANNAANNAEATSSATGRIYGTVILEEGSSTIQNRFTVRKKGSLIFNNGSTLIAGPNYGFYPFATTGSSTRPAAGGVVFEAGSHYYYYSGLSPFGSNSTSYNVEFLPGSKFHFMGQPTNTQMFSNRPYGDIFIENNATITADGTLARVDSFVVRSGATFITDNSGSTPISGHLVVDGTLSAPAANPDRNNRLAMVGSAPQNISGTGTITIGDFIVSNQSNVTLLRSLQVDTSTVVVGVLNPNGNSVTGTGTFTEKAPASYNVTGTTVVDSFLIRDVSDMTGIEVGMSVTGAGIPANTVVTNYSNANMTVTISNRATAGATGTALNIFNGQGEILPIQFGTTSANLVNGQTRINWNVLLEESINHYNIERSANGRDYETIGTVTAAQRSAYAYTDASPAAGVNFYRIKAVGKDGEIKYSNVMKVTNASGKAALGVYPNPVRGNNLNVELSNLEKGDYSLRIMNTSGQTVYTYAIRHQGGSRTQTFTLPAGVRAGIYNLVLTGEQINLVQRLVVE